MVKLCLDFNPTCFECGATENLRRVRLGFYRSGDAEEGDLDYHLAIPPTDEDATDEFSIYICPKHQPMYTLFEIKD